MSGDEDPTTPSHRGCQTETKRCPQTAPSGQTASREHRRESERAVSGEAAGVSSAPELFFFGKEVVIF